MGEDRVVSEADTHSCPSGAYILGGHFIKFLGELHWVCIVVRRLFLVVPRLPLVSVCGLLFVAEHRLWSVWAQEFRHVNALVMACGLS